MTSRDPKEPYDFFYYWNNQQKLPQSHDKSCPPTRDPFKKDKSEADLLEFQRLNKPGQYRDYNDKSQHNPSEAVYKAAAGSSSGSGSYQQPRQGKGKSMFE